MDTGHHFQMGQDLNPNPPFESCAHVRPTTAIMLPPLWVLLHRGRREVGLRRRRRNHILLFGGAN